LLAQADQGPSSAPTSACYLRPEQEIAPKDTALDEGDVIEALGALEPVWDELYPAEQVRILRLLERIDIAPDGISAKMKLLQRLVFPHLGEVIFTRADA
jgi:site-specific DNA recombinase